MYGLKGALDCLVQLSNSNLFNEIPWVLFNNQPVIMYLVVSKVSVVWGCTQESVPERQDNRESRQAT